MESGICSCFQNHTKWSFLYTWGTTYRGFPKWPTTWIQCQTFSGHGSGTHGYLVTSKNVPMWSIMTHIYTNHIPNTSWFVRRVYSTWLSSALGLNANDDLCFCPLQGWDNGWFGRCIALMIYNTQAFCGPKHLISSPTSIMLSQTWLNLKNMQTWTMISPQVKPGVKIEKRTLLRLHLENGGFTHQTKQCKWYQYYVNPKCN